MHRYNSASGRGRRVAGKALIILGNVMLLGSAVAKLAHIPQVMSELQANGFTGGRVTFIGLLEIVSALLFLVPVTRSAGLLMVSAFMGGAIATHLQHGQSIAPPAFVLSLLWLGAWLRHPGILWSLRRAPGGACEPAPRDLPASALQGI